LDSPEERRAEIERLSRLLRDSAPRTRVRAVAQLVEMGPEAVATVGRALALPHADVRVAAAKGLGELRDPTSLPSLLSALQNCDPALGAAIATALGQIGDESAQGILVEILKHRDLTVRAAAANALGELGLDESIPPLMDAYQQCFVGRSALTQRYVGPLVIVAVILMFVLLLWGTMVVKAGGMMALANIGAQFSLRYFGGRRLRSKVACAITEALVKIAERNPRPELHRLVPELRAVARDRMQQEKETRNASLFAADRIEALTAASHALPVSSSTPEIDSHGLPLPAASSDPEAGGCVRVSR